MNNINYQPSFTSITKYVVPKEDVDTIYFFLRNRKPNEEVVVEAPGYMIKRLLLSKIDNKKEWIIDNLNRKNINIVSLELESKDTYNIFKINNKDFKPYMKKFSMEALYKNFKKFFIKTCKEVPMLKDTAHESQVAYATMKYADKLQGDFAKFLEKRKIIVSDIY